MSRKAAAKPNVTPELLPIYQDTFNLFDPKETGIVKNSAIPWLTRILGRMPCNREIEQIVDELDVELVGSLTFVQFCDVMLQKDSYGPYGEYDIREAFLMLDDDDRGYIEVEQLREFLAGTMSEPLEVEEMDALVKLADPNGTGRVDYASFVSRCFSKNPLPPKEKKAKKPKKKAAPVVLETVDAEEDEFGIDGDAIVGGTNAVTDGKPVELAEGAVADGTIEPVKNAE